MRDPIVEARDLAKIYKVYSSPRDRFFEAVTRTSRHREFHALEGVSFSLARGEGLAILGENGAGKSTLLKILAGITTPTSGTLAVNGKIASILELGAGFHPEFSGRQNAVLNAAMEHSGRSLARVGWIALIAAVVVVLAACSITLVAVGDPLLLAIAPLAGFLVAYFGSPLLKAWLLGASFVRPSFSLTH